MSPNLKRRLITAAVGLPLLLGAVIWSPHSMAILAILASCLVGLELSQMARFNRPYTILCMATVATLPIATYIEFLLSDRFMLPGLQLLYFCTLGWIALWSLLAVRGVERKRIVIVFSAIFFGYCLAHAVQIRDSEQGVLWLVLALVIPFANDSVAYFVGRRFGRRKFAPLISPNKSLEGLLAGLACAVAACTFYVAVTPIELAVYWAPLVGLVFGVIGVIGDLYESAVKRIAGVKDSGVLFPGHGGVLDRLDSVAPILPFVFLLATIV